MPQATCHPERRHAAKGLCRDCYETARRKLRGERVTSRKTRRASCHPEKRHHAKGLCYACYDRASRKAFYDANRSVVLKRHKRWHEKNPGKMREYHMKSHYGLTAEEFDTMLLAQGGKCAICLLQRKLVIDHDHTTGKVRGLLCNRCNGLMGDVDADETMIDRLAAYARRVPKLTLVK